MARFITKLKIEQAKNTDSGNWIVCEPLVYESDLIGIVTVPSGFPTDLASVPRIPFIFEFAGDTSSEAACIHDFLYTSKPCTRAMADKVLLEASISTHVPSWRRAIIYAGVRCFGASHW